MFRFAIVLLVLSVGLMGGIYVLPHLNGTFQVPTYGLLIIPYLAITTGTVFGMLLKKKGMALTQSYLMSIVVKMVLGCGFILGIIYLDRQGARYNAALFIIGYFLFTTVEVFFLYRTTSKGRQ